MEAAQSKLHPEVSASPLGLLPTELKESKPTPISLAVSGADSDSGSDKDSRPKPKSRQSTKHNAGTDRQDTTAASDKDFHKRTLSTARTLSTVRALSRSRSPTRFGPGAALHFGFACNECKVGFTTFEKLGAHQAVALGFSHRGLLVSLPRVCGLINS
jgi:hypothetical protein